jgi:hypothetical protein
MYDVISQLTGKPGVSAARETAIGTEYCLLEQSQQIAG